MLNTVSVSKNPEKTQKANPLLLSLLTCNVVLDTFLELPHDDKKPLTKVDKLNKTVKPKEKTSHCKCQLFSLKTGQKSDLYNPGNILQYDRIAIQKNFNYLEIEFLNLSNVQIRSRTIS